MTQNYAIYPSLKGKNVLVSGGASGIGAEIVKGFAEQGAHVAFLDMDATASQALVDGIDGSVTYELCDLRDIDALKASIDRLRDRIGGFDVLVNNAARDDRHDWRDVTSDYYDERIKANLKHFFFTIQAVAPDMI